MQFSLLNSSDIKTVPQYCSYSSAGVHALPATISMSAYLKNNDDSKDIDENNNEMEEEKNNVEKRPGDDGNIQRDRTIGCMHEYIETLSIYIIMESVCVCVYVCMCVCVSVTNFFCGFPNR